MKHRLRIILRYLTLPAVLVGCVFLALFLGGYFDPEPGVGYWGAQGTSWVDKAALDHDITEAGHPFFSADAPADLIASSGQLVSQGAQVLVLALDAPLTQEEQTHLQSLTRQGVTLLFAGAAPDEGFLDGCGDLGWYVGASPALAGELLGASAAELVRSGKAADRNENHLTEYAWVSTGDTPLHADLLHYTLEELEHYGIYNAHTATVQDPAVDSAMAAQQLGEAAEPPELLLASDAAALRALLAARSQLGWDVVPVLGFAADLQEGQALLGEGARTVSCYDQPGVTLALGKLACNALQHRPVFEETGLVPSRHTFWQPHLILES